MERTPKNSLGTPLSGFSCELQFIDQDLSEPVSAEYTKKLEQWQHSTWEKKSRQRRFDPGQCLVNKVGSVHRYFTGDEPCLMWFVLGPIIHAEF